MNTKAEKIKDLKEKIEELQDQLKTLEKKKTLKESLNYSFNYYFTQAMVSCNKAASALLLASDKAEGDGDQEVADLIRTTTSKMKELLQPLWGSNVVHDLLQEDTFDTNQNGVADDKEILLGEKTPLQEGEENDWQETYQKVAENFVINFLGKGTKETELYKLEHVDLDIEKDNTNNPTREGNKGYYYKKYTNLFAINIKETEENTQIELELEEGGTGKFVKALDTEVFEEQSFESRWKNITISGEAITVTKEMKSILDNKFNK